MQGPDIATPQSLPLEGRCSACDLKQLCIPAGIGACEIAELDQVITERRALGRGGELFRSGDAFKSLYAVRTGTFKTHVVAEGDRRQVTGFQIPGDILGLEGIADDKHICTAVALESSEVCVIPLTSIEEMSLRIPGLQRHFLRLMSREIVRENCAMLLLGGMRADVRLANFLVDMLRRRGARGHSPTEIDMRMTREEIGSYLNLTFETVSRVFSRFAEGGILEVRQRRIRVLDAKALERIANPLACQ